MNNKKSFYYYILKYVISWYILPMVLLHELSHILVGLCVGLKIKKVKIFRMTGELPLWNGVVDFKFSLYSYRWLATLYAPVLLWIPILLMFLNPILFYIGLYFITTLVVYKRKVYFLALPSKPDRQYKRKVQYYSYLINNVGMAKFEHYFKVGRLDSLVEFRKLLTEKEYFSK